MVETLVAVATAVVLGQVLVGVVFQTVVKFQK